MSGFRRASNATSRDYDFRVIEDGWVDVTPSLDADEEPHVSVEPRNTKGTIKVFVPQHGSAQDRWLPREGTRIYFVRLKDDTAVYLGTIGTKHDGYQTERRITQTDSDGNEVSTVVLHDDGRVDVDTTGKTTVNIDGDADINVTGTVDLDADGDINIDAAGSVYIQGIEWSTHGHAYDWTDPAGSGVTDGPQ